VCAYYKLYYIIASAKEVM